jgi:hypothetical protein
VEVVVVEKEVALVEEVVLGVVVDEAGARLEQIGCQG